MTKCLLISPRFPDLSYWNFREPCELLGARYPSVPLGLITVAALLPQEWEIRLLDLNVREMDLALLDWADLVMAGGMIPQQRNLLALIELCHARGKRIAVGGQDPTSQPDIYASADYLVLDEGELTIPKFLADLNAGVTRGIYRSTEKPDLTQSPTPRFDLLELRQYLFVGMQFSRGCPLNCEFCDVIELYGRKVRTKTPDQALRELECLYRLGYRGHVDFVDDNFIGNRQAVMAFLVELLSWSRQRGFPFLFSTEATISLANDPTLLDMMEAVDFRYIFVGIETPDADLLIRSQKKINTRHPIVESVHRLNSHGMIVTAGFILGFDGETRAAADNIVACVESAGIPMAMVGLLAALPNTQLTRRLIREGRMQGDAFLVQPGDVDQATSGLNFTPWRPRAEILEDYAALVRQLYSPRRYFGRVLAVVRQLTRHPKQVGSMRGRWTDIRARGVLIWRLGCRPGTSWCFWRTVLVTLMTRPKNFETALHHMALFLHLRKHTRFVLKGHAVRLKAEPEESCRPPLTLPWSRDASQS